MYTLVLTLFFVGNYASSEKGLAVESISGFENTTTCMAAGQDYLNSIYGAHEGIRARAKCIKVK